MHNKIALQATTISLYKYTQNKSVDIALQTMQYNLLQLINISSPSINHYCSFQQYSEYYSN